MYIPYEKIGSFINFFIKSDKIKTFFYNKKVSQNVNYVQKNKVRVLKELNQKLNNNQKLNVIFYIYDETKWKCDSIYELLDKDERFNPLIVVTKSAAKNSDNPTYQTKENVKRTYEYFKNRGMNVVYGYDCQSEKFIPFKKFSPDIIIYQHPWYVETSQGPVVCSEYALTCYVPYYFPIEIENVDNKIDYYLRFHQYIENYYVLDEYCCNKIKSKIENKKVNIVTVGFPHLDKYKPESSGDFVIYAPHWKFNNNGTKYSSFDWSGKFMLEYAKAHPQTKWLFRAHPLLYNAIINEKLMTKEEADEYYQEWKKIGEISEGGDYIELFDKSKMLITDSGSFLGEYIVTQNPVIILAGENSHYKPMDNYILKSYYCANTIYELDELLNNIKINDYMKDKRAEALEKSGLRDCNASKKIIHDIMKQIQEG